MRRTLAGVLRRPVPAPVPASVPAVPARPDYEIRAEADLLLTYRDLILGPGFFGTDLYSELLSAMSTASQDGAGLTELLLRFGITDVIGLMLLLRAVTLTTSISTLGWVVNDTLPPSFLHQLATYRHPLSDPD